jgi:plasmid stability protein
MSTLTIPAVSDELRRKLAERAQANHRSVEAEALCCLQEAIETEELLLGAIPGERWNEIERSVCETIHDRGTPLTDDDFQRYRDLARGSNRS